MHAQFRTAVANKLELEKTTFIKGKQCCYNKVVAKKMCITALSKHNNKGNILRLLAHGACPIHTRITKHVKLLPEVRHRQIRFTTATNKACVNGVSGI